MVDQIKLVTVEGDAPTLDTMIANLQSADGAPRRVPPKSILVISNMDRSKSVVLLRYHSETERRLSISPLDALNPPSDGLGHVLVENYEVIFEDVGS